MHYLHLDKDTKKPQFTYCRLNLEDLETLLKNQGISPSITKGNGSLGQGLGQATQGPINEISNSIQNNQDFNENIKETGPLGFEPRTFSLEG